VRKWQHADVISVFGLPRDQARALAKRLLPASTPEAWLDMIAEESQGHPLFMSELVQYTESHDFAARGQITLEAALRARIERLDRKSRELLEMVAIAARPHPRAVFSMALVSNVDESARVLLASKLLRQRKGHELGCFHDRIRHAVVALIAKAQLPALHHQLAAALERSTDADPAEQAHHWDLAGKQERAGSAYEAAARRALSTMAFSRAALLCERAMALSAEGYDGRFERLTVLRADALACAGQSGEAAAFYQRAADAARGDARIKLRSRAAAQLILSAQIATGIAATRKLVTELGFSMPKQPALALLRYAWEALRLFLQGKDESLSPRAVSAHEQNAQDVVRDLLYIVAIVHPLAYVLLSIQLLRRGAGVGGASEIALRLVTRAWFRAMNGSLATVKPLVERAERISAGSRDARSIAMRTYAAGSALTAALDWVGAAAYLETAHRIAQEECADSPWLLTSIRYHLGSNLFQRGEHARLARESVRWIEEARERNDVLAVCLLVGTACGYVRHLIEDKPDAAQRELSQAVAPIDRDFYSFPHFGALLGMVYSLLYQGGGAALIYIDDHVEGHRDASLLRSRMCQEALRLCRALALLSAYAVAASEERKLLLKQAGRTVRELEAGRTLLAQSAGALARAQLELLANQRERALSSARAALVGLKNLQHQSARAATYLIGVLEGGAQGREKCRAVIEELRSHGWRDPARALSMHLPVYRLLEEQLANAREAAPRDGALLLGRYEVTGQLGAGGFGAVVAARDVRSGHALALKELVHVGGGSIERFKQEFRALSDLHHEHVVELEALFEHEGRWYMAMELVEGKSLIDYARPHGKPERERIVRAFAGAARGLCALHETGFAHRDVKPDNVLVTREGRAVLIDFGLSARIGHAALEGGVGTLEYAAPEQLRGAGASAESDVYGLGACLHHALYGVPRAREQQAPARSTAQLDAGAQLALAQLSELCAAMLHEDPSARPGMSEVVTRLSGQQAAPLASSSSASLLPVHAASREDEFAGRENELAALSQALGECRHSGLRVVLIQGESGLGKSALMDAFTRQAKRSVPQLERLFSRCYENELVPFKSFDGAIDQIAQLLRALPLDACEALLPKRAALLAQLFPALASVGAIAQAPRKGLPADPATRKQLARECLVQLLVNLSARAPMIVMIDDLQWADLDSFDLLAALLHRRAELPLLLVASLRPEAEIEPAIAAQIAELGRHEAAQRIELAMLAEEPAERLARRMLGAGYDPLRLQTMVAESKGHPLFLRELVAHEQSGLGGRSAASLDAVLGARIEALSAEARNLLTLVAVASKPYAVSLYARALGRSDLPRDALLSLLQARLLTRRGDKLTVYHDRLRRVTLDTLDQERRRTLAGQLARALSSDARTDPAERARLWDEAGESAKASEAYELAGDSALAALAFTQAGAHLARALALLGDQRLDARYRRLLVAQGQALVCAGRSAEAALCFQRAAELASGEEAVRLRLWAAQHLLQSAQVDRGLMAARKLLGELGLSLPESDRAARATIAWERARVKLRGIELKQRPISPERRLVLEALRGLSAPVRSISLLPGSALVVQYLRRALDAGDPVHAARALAYEAFWRAINDPAKSQDALFDRAHGLAESTCEPALMAEVDLMRGFACVAQYRAKSAPDHLWRAHELLSSQCPGERWLLTASRMYLGVAWSYSGAFGEIKRHMGAWVEDALAREDRYAVAALTGFGAASIRHVMDEDPGRALDELELAMAPWPSRPFATNHFGAFQCTTQVLASARSGDALLRYLEARRPELDAVFFARTPSSRIIVLAAHAQGLLQAMSTLRGQETAALVARARAQAAELKRIPGVVSNAWSLGIETSLCMIEDERELALAHVERAAALTSATDHRITFGIRYMQGLVRGGSEGRALCMGVRAQLADEGFKNVDRALAMLTPINLTLWDRA
jgi:predicted ATPase